MDRTLGTTAAAIALVAALALGACAPTRTNEGTSAYVDDAAITSKVKAAILEDPALKVMQINVTTYKDVVQLSGFVDRRQMIGRTGRVASRVSGVASVENNLIVK